MDRIWEIFMQTLNKERSLYPGIFMISAATLLLELTLTRIFEVILWNHMAYMIVSSAIFGFGLGGVFIMRWPMPRFASERLLAMVSAGFAASVLLLIPAIKLIPASTGDIPDHPIRQMLAFGILYIFLLAPFFASGLVVSTIVTRYAPQIHRLYFWDLLGAGIGCLGVFLLPTLLGGAEETLLFIAAAGALSAALFAVERSGLKRANLVAAVGLAALTVILSNRIEFGSLTIKRKFKLGTARERVEFSRWDPISKIDVLRTNTPYNKQIVYDGGAQQSSFRAFDGNFEALRKNYFELINGKSRYNSGKHIALAHWLKRDSSPQTLIIGSAGGQETLAALTWGAAHVDAVEMVCTVIKAATGPYGAYTGHIFADPRVSVKCDEGRSFLRHSNRTYDIIQIHSNHTTSSIANGSGGGSPKYLQTVEAYKEFLSHLSKDGILQINYCVYPRMITTAAKAWSELFPGEDFRRHLLLTTGPMVTFLVKRSAWSKSEIAAIRYFLSPAFPSTQQYNMIYAPGEPEAANVPDEFFQVPLSQSFQAALPYKVFPPTDDRPFFTDLRKEIRQLRPDTRGYVPADTAEFMNLSLRKFIPMESAHLYFLGGLSVVVATIIIMIPLLWSRRSGLNRPETVPMLIYFSCLGAGFVIVELVLMSKFVLLIGFPIYSMATVLFTLLFSAGVGSYLSGPLSRSFGRWTILTIPVFALIMVLLVVAFPHLRNLTLGMSQLARILLVAAFLIPVGIPLGMPFPLGIAALNLRASNLIPWAWGINGFMTVVGSLLSVILTMKLGFDRTLFIAVAIYFIALLSFFNLSRATPADGVRARKSTWALLNVPKA
jgi:spermidine synthase